MPDLSLRKTAAFLFLAVLFIWLPRLSFMGGRSVYHLDEALYASVADVVHDGGMLYRDVMEMKPPVHFYFLALVFRLFGKGNLTALHAALAFVITLTAFLLYGLMAAVRNRRAGVLAALIFSVASFNQDPLPAFSFQIEWLQIVFSCAAVWLLIAARRKGNWGLTFASGLSFGLAFMTKQTAVFDAAPALALLLFGLLDPSRSKGSVFKSVLYLLAGMLAVIAGFSIYFYSAGAWEGYSYAVWKFVSIYLSGIPPYLGISQTVRVTFFYSGLVLNAFILLYPAAAVLIYYFFIKRFSGQKAEIYFLGLWAISTLAAAFSEGLSNIYYFIPVLPPFCLLAAGGFEAALKKFESSEKRGVFRKLPAFTLLFVLIAFFYPVQALLTPGSGRRFRWWSVPWVVYPKQHRNLRLSVDERNFKELITYLDAHTRPTDRLFVWSVWGEPLKPEIYVLAKRDPATRFVNCIFLTGLPPHDKYDISAYPAWKHWKDDMDKHAPKFVIDTSRTGPHPDFYPVFRQYLKEHYRPLNWPRKGFPYRLYRRTGS